MHWSTLFSLFALPGTLAFPGINLFERASATDATLYGYGTNIYGYPLLYDQTSGNLYVSATNATIAGLQSVTWNIPAMSKASTTTTTATMLNGTSAGGLHLATGNSGVSAVSVDSNATAGVTIYGQQLVWISGSSVEAKFWAQSTEVGGAAAYQVTWNAQNALETGLTPLVVKIAAPATLG